MGSPPRFRAAKCKLTKLDMTEEIISDLEHGSKEHKDAAQRQKYIQKYKIWL